MARTTIDLDDGVLRELKRRREAEGRPMGEIASELLARSIAADEPESTPGHTWTAAPMGAKFNIEDKDAVWAVLDAP